MAAVDPEACTRDSAEGIGIGGEAPRAKRDRIGRAGFAQEFAPFEDQRELLILRKTGEFEADFICRSPAIGLRPHRMDVELHLLPRCENRADHAPDRLEPE